MAQLGWLCGAVGPALWRSWAGSVAQLGWLCGAVGPATRVSVVSALPLALVRVGGLCALALRGFGRRL